MLGVGEGNGIVVVDGEDVVGHGDVVGDDVDGDDGIKYLALAGAVFWHPES